MLLCSRSKGPSDQTPTAIQKCKGVTCKFEVDDYTFTLLFDGGHWLIVEYDTRNHLPIGYAIVSNDVVPPLVNPQANLTLFDNANQNVCAGHRLLMNWHRRFGHLNFRAVQRSLCQFPFISVKLTATSQCNLTDFWCKICQYTKAHRSTTQGKRTQVIWDQEFASRSITSNPGSSVELATHLGSHHHQMHAKEVAFCGSWDRVLTCGTSIEVLRRQDNSCQTKLWEYGIWTRHGDTIISDRQRRLRRQCIRSTHLGAQPVDLLLRHQCLSPERDCREVDPYRGV